MRWQWTLAGAVALALVGGCERREATYAAGCATPPGHWGTEKGGIGHLRVPQPIYLMTDGSVIWNRAPISDDVLYRYMHQMSGMSPEPHAVLVVSPAAPCDRVAAVRAIMSAAELCQGPHPLCSEGWNWQQWPIAGKP